MNRLTSNDKNFGLITVAKWINFICAYVNILDDDDREIYLLFAAFGLAVRLSLTPLVGPLVKRLTCPRRYGLSLSDIGNGYDFFQFFFGVQTYDSSSQVWSKHLPWKQWRHVRTSLYTPTGEHFYTEPHGADFMEYFGKKEQCPKVHFNFEDHDGEVITATCLIEEREWHKGSGWFRWLRWFSKPRILRSLDIKFSAEVGPNKGSWNGGITGHGIDMLPDETTKKAFERYCANGLNRNGKIFKLRFIGPCEPPATNEPEMQRNVSNDVGS